LGGFDYIQGIWWENHGKSIAKPRPVVPIAENYQSRRQGSPKISIDRLLHNSRLAPQEEQHLKGRINFQDFSFRYIWSSGEMLSDSDFPWIFLLFPQEFDKN
jgi:hypothetical protein